MLDFVTYQRLYEDFHAHPELSNQERRTASLIQAHLEALGCLDEIHCQIGGHGVVGVSKNGQGNVVLLRADMDGLPLLEKTDLKYASKMEMTDARDGVKKPVMHACGHDLHMTSLLAATEILVKHLRHAWQGTLVVVFQPAEERGTGASAMVQDGLYDKVPRPHYSLGQHVVANLPAGHIGLKPGVIMTGADSIIYKLFGRGSHASQPHRSVDPSIMAANLVLQLQTIVSRETSPNDLVVVSAVPLTSGVAENIIPDELQVGVDVRTADPITRRQVLESVDRKVSAVCLAAGTPRSAERTMTRHFPATSNNTAMTQKLEECFANVFKHRYEAGIPTSTIAEDFPNLCEGSPYVFWHLGSGDSEKYSLNPPGEDQKPLIPMNHTSTFSPVVDITLKTGMEALVAGALTFFALPTPSRTGHGCSNI